MLLRICPMREVVCSGSVGETCLGIPAFLVEAHHHSVSGSSYTVAVLQHNGSSGRRSGVDIPRAFADMTRLRACVFACTTTTAVAIVAFGASVSAASWTLHSRVQEAEMGQARRTTAVAGVEDGGPRKCIETRLTVREMNLKAEGKLGSTWETSDSRRLAQPYMSTPNIAVTGLGHGP
jgi:hypothetical protein